MNIEEIREYSGTSQLPPGALQMLGIRGYAQGCAPGPLRRGLPTVGLRATILSLLPFSFIMYFLSFSFF